jgi:hypothetical protein
VSYSTHRSGPKQAAAIPEDWGDSMHFCAICWDNWEGPTMGDEEPSRKDPRAVYDLIRYSLTHSRADTIAHFPIFEPIRIASLYQHEQRVRERMAGVLFGRLVEVPTGEGRRRRAAVRVSLILKEDSTGWQELAIRLMEDG